MSDWSETWRTGNQRLDSEHAEMFALIEALHRVIGAGQAHDPVLLARIEAGMTEHFRYEHELMRSSLCPTMISHDRYHAQLTESLTLLSKAWEQADQVAAQIACATFRDQFIYHQDIGADREMLKHLRVAAPTSLTPR